MKHKDSPRKAAAALTWDPAVDDAPRLIAAGKGPLADKILALADEAGIPIVEKEPLADALFALEPGQSIPPELFRLAAEVYIFLRDLGSSGNPGGADHTGQDPGNSSTEE